MKPSLVIPFLAAIACAPMSSFGQSPAPAPSDTPAAAPSAPQPSAPSPAPAMHPPGRPGMLTPDEGKTLMAASKKAQQDPRVQAAAAKMHEAMQAARDAMVAKNKSLGPIIDKISASPSPGAERPHLTPDETSQLKAGRQSIMGTPEADAWQKATAEYRETLRKVMSEDPAVAAILAKLPQPGMGHAFGGPGGIPRPAVSPITSPQAAGTPSASPQP